MNFFVPGLVNTLQFDLKEIMYLHLKVITRVNSVLGIPGK